MSAVGPVAVIVGAIGALCFLALLGRLWVIGAKGEAPVGPRQAPRSVDPLPPALPTEFRSLISDEASQWKQAHEWMAVISRLDELAEVLGAGAAQSDPPPKYSADWLEHRVAQIEATAGGPGSENWSRT